jgi:hypothetical protein
MPPQACQATGNGRVHIDPEKIMLSRIDDQGESNQRVTGTIVLLMAEGEKVRVVVNIGVLMVVLMDRLDYEHERPAIGETVALQFTGASVSLLDSCASQS